MSAISYHLAHEPYIDAVAAAVTAAGVELADWGAETNEPRNSHPELIHRGPAQHPAPRTPHPPAST